MHLHQFRLFGFITILFTTTQAYSSPASLGSFGVLCEKYETTTSLSVLMREEIFEAQDGTKSYRPYVKVLWNEGRKSYAASTTLEATADSLFNVSLPLARQYFFDPAEPESVNLITWTRLGSGKTRLEYSLVSDVMHADRIYLDASINKRFPEQMSVELKADVYVLGTDETRKITLTPKALELTCSKVRVKNTNP
jgi:hypothetical protein